MYIRVKHVKNHLLPTVSEIKILTDPSVNLFYDLP